MNYLSTVADVLEVFGFIATIFVYRNVRKLERVYLFKARIPELSKELSGKAWALSLLHQTFRESTQNIQLELAETEVLLRSIRAKVDGTPRKTVTAAIRSIRKYPEKATAAGLWDVYRAIQACLVELRELERDLKWEKQ